MLNRFVLVGVAAALVVAATACSESDPPATVSSSSSTTTSSNPPSTTSTSTAAPTTTSTTSVPTTPAPLPPVDLPLAAPGAPAYEVLFTVPNGPGGITYVGGGEDQETSGPSAIAAGDDGAVWITDPRGLRLLRFDRSGNLTLDIDTDADAVGPLMDVVARPGGAFALEAVPALDRYRIVDYNDQGELLASYELPDGLHLEDGLSGLAMTPDGQLWVEFEGGRRTYSVFDAAGDLDLQRTDGYESDGLVLAPLGGTRTLQFQIGDEIFKVQVTEFGGLGFEGMHDRAVALLLADASSDDEGALVVRVDLIWVDQGEIVARGTYPLDIAGEEAYVPQDYISIAPDGYVIALLPRRDSIEVLQINVFAE